MDRRRCTLRCKIPDAAAPAPRLRVKNKPTLFVCCSPTALARPDQDAAGRSVKDRATADWIQALLGEA